MTLYRIAYYHIILYMKIRSIAYPTISVNINVQCIPSIYALKAVLWTKQRTLKMYMVYIVMYNTSSFV